MNVARALALATLLACAPASAQTVDRANYKEGDTWTYRHTEHGNTYRPGAFQTMETKTITKMLSDEFEMSSITTSERGEKTARTQRSSLDFNDYAQASPDVARVEVKTWVWPVEVGKKWKYEVPVASGVQVWEARVIAWEEVEVPAGRFKALKVEREMVANPHGSNRHMVIVWYSPDAKANVRVQRYSMSRSAMTFDYTRELVAYQVQ